jgi:hypothetical protein
MPEKIADSALLIAGLLFTTFALCEDEVRGSFGSHPNVYRRLQRIGTWDEWHCRDVIGARIGLGVARGCFFDPAKLGIDID